ncbi:MAG: hypothetical protein WKG07_27770 [Hymenobacter sp.]
MAVPLHVIWGRHDAFLSANLAQESLAFCDDGPADLPPSQPLGAARRSGAGEPTVD